MAKKKPANSAATLIMPDYSSIYKEMQESANKTSLKIQQMSDATTAKTFAFNKEEAEKSRKWQENMSNTSHQREVADLKAAGLNPVLSANQGAQSYTTSSASGSAENPASAVAQLESSKMSAAANAYTANLSARATEKAAQISSAATLAAAHTSAMATKYASDNNYKLGVYKAGLDYQAKKYASDKSAAASNYAANMAYKAVLDKPVGNPLALADKYFLKTLGSDGAKKVGKITKKLITKANSYFVGKHNKPSNFTLTTAGNAIVNTALKELGIKASKSNRILYVKGMVFADKSSLGKLRQMSPAKIITDADITPHK